MLIAGHDLPGRLLTAIAEGTLLVATIPPQSSGPARWIVQPLGLKEFPNGRIKSYFIWALGEDDDGELYVLANGMNSVAHTSGKVFKLVPQ